MIKDVHGADTPAIVKYSVFDRNGVRAVTLNRNAIGYVSKGTKYIHYGDIRYEISKGDVFFLNIGTHYIEEIPEKNKPFEELVVYYTPDMISDALSMLSLNFRMVITVDHKCSKCERTNHANMPAWGLLRYYFSSLGQYMRDDKFASDSVIEKLKLTELICMIMSHGDCCLSSKILVSADNSTESFERTIQKHIFEDLSMEELAERCGRSLTSFKKDFKRHFHDSPHRWLNRQRLTHARMLLVSTSRTVSDIGNECKFRNTSHFIKLFRNEFGYTPAVYRAKSLSEAGKRNEKEEKAEKQAVL